MIKTVVWCAIITATAPGTVPAQGTNHSQSSGVFARETQERQHYHLTARVNGRGQSWAAGTTLYLMRRGSEWSIVSSSSWIT
jgi:hypothetical protein